MNSLSIIIAISASIFSGLATGVFALFRENKRDKIRQQERSQDILKLELKDLQINLYKLERDLDEWKDKYFEAIQELIRVKSELESTLLRLSHLELHDLED